MKSHPSCKIIKHHVKNRITFTFRGVATDEVKKVVHDLKNIKAAGGEIPVKILKIVVVYVIFQKIALINQLNLPIFLIVLKTGNITPVFKKDDPLDKL